MDFGDARPQPVPRYGSLVQWDNPVQLPLGLATAVRNCRYTAQSVATRWGYTTRLTFGAQGSAITGLGAIRYLSEDNRGTEIAVLLGYTATDGNIWAATPFNQTTVSQLSTDALLALANLSRTPNLNPRIEQAFNRGYVALGDLTKGKAQPMVYDPAASTLDPASDIPFAAPWNPVTAYRVGHMVSPSSFQTFGLPVAQGVWYPTITGQLYRCVKAGISAGAQPVWPTATNGTVNDGTVQWEEYTPTCASGLADPAAPINPATTADPNSPIAAGATVFVVLTYTSANGESTNDLTNAQGGLDASKVLQFTNATGGSVDLTVTMPPIPAALAAGGPLGANGATGYNVYAYVVTGAPDASKYVDGSYYAQVAAGVAAGGTATISSWPTGQALPTINTATIVGPGNVDTGIRWMVVMFETRTEYQTGFSISAPIKVSVTQSGLGVLAEPIPVGPYNTIRRLCAFTVAGASSAGPYTYIDQADVESPGFNQPDIAITSTCLNDNVATSAVFNFTDTYLPGASDVTNYFQRVQIPPCSDVYFAKTIQRLVYTGCKGFPSGCLVCDLNDMEAVRVPGSNIQVAEADGDRTVCWREVRENQIVLKENSGHVIIPNAGDPSTWPANRLWDGMGPTGAKAIAVGVEDQSEFMVFAHRSGPYRYIGGVPQHIGREIQMLWDSINWTVGHLIVVAIDQQRREVHFSVPLGSSVVRNAVLTVNYYFGWSDPVVFVQRKGILVPNVEGRKWSVNDVSASELVFVPQRYNADGVPVGSDLANNFIKAGTDGAVYTLTENQYFDQNYAGVAVGYLSLWKGVPAPNPNLAITQLLGASCSAIGKGPLNIYAFDEKGVNFPLSRPERAWNLTGTESQRDFGAVAAHASRFGVGFDNGAVPGNWFEMHITNLWVAPTFATRPG